MKHTFTSAHTYCTLFTHLLHTMKTLSAAAHQLHTCSPAMGHTVCLMFVCIKCAHDWCMSQLRIELTQSEKINCYKYEKAGLTAAQGTAHISLSPLTFRTTTSGQHQPGLRQPQQHLPRPLPSRLGLHHLIQPPAPLSPPVSHFQQQTWQGAW